MTPVLDNRTSSSKYLPNLTAPGWFACGASMASDAMSKCEYLNIDIKTYFERGD